MATKTIQTRIRNKIDSYSNWNTENPVLLDGEIGIVRITTQQSDIATGGTVDTPAYLIKVGDGTTAFNSLPWVCAKASDVYDWAKLQDPSGISVKYGDTSLTLANVLKGLQEAQTEITALDKSLGDLGDELKEKPDSNHTHDDRYYTEGEVDSKIAAAVSSALKYKGSKSTTNELPTSNNATGDVWNIASACAESGTLPKVNAGDNVAWNGTVWDVLAGTVDLSSYYSRSEVDSVLETKVDTDDSRLTDARIPIAHNHASDTITAMTGYSKAASVTAISVTDSLNAAIGKLEKALDAKGTSNLTIGTTATTAAAGNHTHSTYEASLKNIESTYAKFDSATSKLYINADEIIFDCGGAAV